jgi:hypothetical protein
MNYVAEALEEQVRAIEHLRERYRNPPPEVGEPERQQWKTDLHALERAEPFYWNDRCRDLIITAMQDFKLEDIECSRHLVYSEFAWCWFGGKPLFMLETLEKDFIPVRAITWFNFTGYDGQSYLGMTAYAPVLVTPEGAPTGAVVPVLWACVNHGEKMSTQIRETQLQFIGYSDEQTLREVDQMKLFICASSTFLRQEILPVVSVPLERHARKRLEKKGYEAKPISVVQLRRTATGEKHESESTSAVEWNYQWTVRGHVRQQYYKTLNEHLPIWIHPHLKGPADKPLKPRSFPIYAVTR